LPKQFVPIGSDKSLLEMTVARARLLAPDERILCVAGEDHRAPVKQVAANYYRWCELNGERPLSRRMLGDVIVSMGFPSKSMRYFGLKQRCYMGLRLRDEVGRPIETGAQRGAGRDDDVPF